MGETPDIGKVVGTKAATSAKSGRQGERTDDALLDAIYRAVQDRPQVRAAVLYREIERDPTLAPLLVNNRAFRGHVAAMRELIDQGRWSPVQADDDEARLVLPVVGRLRQVEAPYHERIRELLADETSDARGRRVLRETVSAAGPQPYWPTRRVAKWIARLRRWVPGLEHSGDYLFPAWQYAAREARGAPTDDLDAKMAEIAARIWRAKEESK